ncbi:MAG: nitronate monooxygenase [Candidatus Marinimicrobia bacterium]|nr:nitronate monooxygenase [Candidatus Neomarinimicrobiota bacterium]
MMLPELKIGNLEVEKAIIQGGMGVGISLSGLATAVANEGGIGVISSIGIGYLKGERNKKGFSSNAHYLRDEIRRAKDGSTRGAIGVNIMVAISDFDELVKASIEEKADIIFAGAGLPLNLPGLARTIDPETQTKLGVIVSSARAANIICQSWHKKYHCLPDIIVVEGPKAGGHLGFHYDQIFDPNYSLEKILPEVWHTVHQFAQQYKKEIPIIAAGGIFTGEDIYQFMSLGADGVQMGTRFVATHECDAETQFKEVYVNCREDQVSIITSPVGLPGRVIKTEFIQQIEAGHRKPFTCPWKCLKTCNFKEAPYCIAEALINAQQGKMENGFAFAGSNVYKVDRIISVRELFRELEIGFDLSVAQYLEKDPLEFGNFRFVNL